MVLVDIDGVVLDLLGACKKVRPEFNPDGVESYDYKKGAYGIPRAEILAMMSDKSVFELQEPYEGAVEALNDLRTFIGTIAYTSVPKHIEDLRVAQCSKLGFSHIYCYEGDKPVLPETVVIEDKPEQLEKFAVESPDTLRILIDRPYNKECNCAIRVKDLREAVEVINREVF